MTYCVIHEGDLLDLLRKAHDGEDPGTVYAEWCANTEHEYVAPEEPPRMSAERIDLLRHAAAGRLEYAAGCTSNNPSIHEQRVALEHEAVVIALCIKVLEGDDAPLYSWLPSWRWEEAGLGHG